MSITGCLIAYDCSYLLRAFLFSSAVIGGITGKVVWIFSVMVSSFDTAFFSGFFSDVVFADGDGDAESEDDEDDNVVVSVSVSRGGVFSDDSVASSVDELPTPKKPFSFPEMR
jgi:hypothetical protein